MAASDTGDVVFRHVDRHDLERRSRPESSHKGNLKRLKTSSVGGFQRWEKENELLWAMLEDETEWLGKLFPDVIITPELFFYALEDGVVLCRLANLIQKTAEEHGRKNKVNVPSKRFKFHKSISKKNKQLALFKSRENVSGFLNWCRQIGISDSILFESNDVVEADECREGCREVVICLMEIARRAAGAFKFTPIPKLIQLEKEIEIEEQNETEEEIDQVDYASSDEELSNSPPSPGAHSPPTRGNHPFPGGTKKKSKRNQPKSELDQEVFKIIDNFNVYNIRKIKEGKYMILGKIIFVRMLNGHVLLRIGGGWDTLEHYLLTHLPKAASENGHCSQSEVNITPSVSKTPQKSQSQKIFDKVKKEQHLKATPVSSAHRPAGVKGSKTDDSSGDDEKDITSAIRKIEFSVNQNIATRRKISRHSQEDTPQKSPNSVEENAGNLNTPSDINQNNIPKSEGQEITKSKSPKKSKGKNMENGEFSKINGNVEYNSAEQNGDLVSFGGDLKEDAEVTNNADVVDGTVLAKLAMELPTNTDPTAQEEIKVDSEPNPDTKVDPQPNPDIEIDSPSAEKQSSVPEVTVENSEEPSVEQAAPVVEVVDDFVPSESGKHDNDVPLEDADVVPNDPEVSPSNDLQAPPPNDTEVSPTEPAVPPSKSEIPASDLVVPPVIPKDAADSESPAPESTSSASTTPDVPHSPQKSPSPTEVKNGVESPKKQTGKTTKEPTKSKPAGTKAPAKKEPATSAGTRPKSAKPSTRPTTTTKKLITAGTKATGTTGTARPSTATKTTTAGKPSTIAAKTKSPPSGKSTTKTTDGKVLPSSLTAAKKPTPSTAATSTRTTKPDSKTTPTTRPAKSTSAFGSTVSAPKKSASTRPATAPPARSTTTQAKKKPATAKVQSWSGTARPQSAKPSTKVAKDSTDGEASSKETGADRPSSPTKPLVRKTQTRTVTTLKTTRVGASGEPEVKSQTIKTTRTVTEANGKKTTKTTVKELAPTGRKPLRMTTETTERGSGAKTTDSKTGTKAKKPETKPATKTGSSRPCKETGAKKASTKGGPKSKEVNGNVKGVLKAKNVKELSNALGITKPADGKEVKAEPKETVKKEEKSPSREETPELPPAEIKESPKVEELVQDQETVQAEVSPEPQAVAPVAKNSEIEVVSEIVGVESGVELTPQGHDEGGNVVVNTEEQSVQRDEITENMNDKAEGIVNEIVRDDVQQSEDIVSDVDLLESSKDVETEQNIGDKSDEKFEETKPFEVEEARDAVADEIAADEEASGENVQEESETIVQTTEAVIPDEHKEVLAPESPEPQDPAEPDLIQDVDESLEDSLDVIEVPESDLSHDENVLQSTEAWPAVSADHAQDLDNNNAAGVAQETEPKFDQFLLPSHAGPEDGGNDDPILLDISSDGKADSLFAGDMLVETPKKDSGFQEHNIVDDLLG